MDIENCAVNAVDDAISSTDMLTPMFNKKDREPLWDGNIFVYEDKKKDNRSLLGRIPVQIKGKEAKLLNREQTTFRIPLTNLERYRSEGGIMYFVVLIRRENDGKIKRTIYYNALLPYDINNIINRRGASGSKDRSVIMKKFPTDMRGIYLCCKKFLKDRSNQDYNKGGSNPTLQDIAEKMDISEFTYSFSLYPFGNRADGAIDEIFNQDFYIYAKDEKRGITIALQHVAEVSSVNGQLDVDVSVGDKTYYSSINAEHNKDGETRLHIGPCIILSSDDKGFKEFSFKEAGTLYERINAFKLFIAMIQGKQMKIGDTELNMSSVDFKEGTLDEAKSRLHHLLVVKRLLEVLGVEQDMDCDNFSDGDSANLEVLINGILYHREICLEKKNEIHPIVGLSISNLNLLVYFEKVREDGVRDWYRVENFFEKDRECSVHYHNDDGTEDIYQSSQYTFLKQGIMANISHFDYEAAERSLFRWDNEIHIQRVNFHLLETLKAYDTSKTEELLSYSESIAEWLYGMSNDKYDYINMLQIRKRMGTWSEKDEEEVFNMIGENTGKWDVLAALYILCGNGKMADQCISRLPKDQMETFREYPIYSLIDEG